MPIMDYLNELGERRTELQAALQQAGVTLSVDATFSELVPAAANILTRTSEAVFINTMSWGQDTTGNIKTCTFDCDFMPTQLVVVIYDQEQLIFNASYDDSGGYYFLDQETKSLYHTEDNVITDMGTVIFTWTQLESSYQCVLSIQRQNAFNTDNCIIVARS